MTKSAGKSENTPEPRQKVVKTGRRRAVLTPAPGTDASPETPGATRPDDIREGGAMSERDREMLRNRPPHHG